MALEFALMFVFGLLPLLLLTFAGVLTFYAQQGLTLAAADGARAALRYPAQTSSVAPTLLDVREQTARNVAARRMDWLLNATGKTKDVAITATHNTCPADASITCVTVTTRALCKDNSTAFCWWMLVGDMSSQATVQVVDATGTNS